MKFCSSLRPTNCRIRIIVGVLLAVMIGVQCTQRSATINPRRIIAPVESVAYASTPSINDSQLESMAKTDQAGLLQKCLDHYRATYSDYDTTFIKQERILGRLGKEQTISAQFMQQPFSVGLAWQQNAPTADRVLYVEGKYDNQLLARPASSFLRSLAPVVARDPAGPEAMRETLRPVSMFGFERMMQSLLAVYATAAQNGDLKQQFGGYANVMGRRTLVLVRYLPQRQEYAAYKTVICVDPEYMLPVCVEGYDWPKAGSKEPGDLLCRYVYSDMKFNVGHTAADFAPAKFDMAEPKPPTK